MPPRKHVPTTGELVYKSVGKKGRFKLVSVPKHIGPSTSQPQANPPPPASIAPPTVLDGAEGNNQDPWPQETCAPLETPKKSGKVGFLQKQQAGARNQLFFTETV